ncbi:MAG: hypothetical protein ACKOJI_06295 [Phycisphaerales bacterium]
MSVSVAILSVAVLMGQATPPPSPPAGSAAAPAAPPPAKQAPADPPPPSLDDALGIGGGERADQPPSAIEESLSGAKPRDILQSALDDMARSADLLDSKEAGLPTRRAQQSVLRKLDELIATARRMQQQQQQQAGQSGGAQQRRNQQGRQQQDGQSGQGPGQDEPRPGADDKSRRRAGDRDGAGRPQGQRADSGAQEPPEAVDPTDQMAQFDESRAEWGRLPPRVREAVRQGLRDPMSAAYRRLTQVYYRRLAEEQRR